MSKFQRKVQTATRHGWTVRNYDATYTYMGRVDSAGRFCGLAITRTTGRVAGLKPVEAGKHNAK